MAEEFQESEVIFEGSNINEDDEEYCGVENRSFKRKKLKCDKKKAVPVNIPVRNTAWFHYVDADYCDDDGEMVPPHVIVGRRVAGKMMAFSVCSGNGRTLKGRDLSQVRNSVLRMTGFLET